MNHLSVPSCSSKHNWLSGHLHKSLIGICIQLSFWCECTPHLTMTLHGRRGDGTMDGTCLSHAIHRFIFRQCKSRCDPSPAEWNLLINKILLRPAAVRDDNLPSKQHVREEATHDSLLSHKCKEDATGSPMHCCTHRQDAGFPRAD